MRISPPEPSSNFNLGTRKRGNDGNMWIVTQDINGRKRWVKSTHSTRTKSYNTRSTRTKSHASTRTKSNASTRTKSHASTRTKSSIKKFTPMLAQTYKQTINPIGYWASEKLDGIRSIFIDGKLRSRTNHILNAPQWFLDTIQVPSGTILDGELYTSSGDFSQIMSIVSKKNPINSEWKKIKYVVFDIPSSKKTFEERSQQLEQIIQNIDSPFIQSLKHTKIQSKEHLDKLLQTTIKKGGEGLMLRKPNSYYEHKRSNTLLKVKTFLDDEAIVLYHELGNGKYCDVLGNLVVEWYKGPNKGIEFSIGSGFTDLERKNYKKLFPKGTIVKFKYFEISKTSGKPRFPTFLGVRDSRDI